jgi:molybdenum cofactor cytidylyltransferase
MGEPKQLLPWDGEPLVRRAARTALTAGLSPVVVVTGAAAERVGRAVDDLAVQIAYNPAWQSGQSSSLAAGLQALPVEIGAAIFLLADQPFVPPELLRELVALHARTFSPLVAPQADGRRANPVLFDRTTFPELRALTGDVGGRRLFSRYPVAWLPWLDARLLLDVDTPEDYRRMLEV